MSVTSVEEISEDTTSDRKQTKPTPPEYEYRAVRLFRVYTDSLNDTPVTAETASSIPTIGSAYPGDTTRRVQSVSARREQANRLVYVVTVEYSSKATEGDAVAAENPLSRPREVSWDFEESTEPIYDDGAGTAITNSANITFDPPIQEKVSDLVMTYTKNFATFDAPKFIDYKDAVNNDPFQVPGGYTIDPGVAKIVGFSANEQTENNITFFRITIKIAFRPNYSNGNSGWTRNIVDEGRVRLNPYGVLPWQDKYIAILDAQGQPVTDPVPLDGTGQPLEPGLPVNFISVLPRKFRPFGILNLS